MPTNSLAYAGENATVLIHEATMDNDQADLAAAKAHSTVGQALDVGKRYLYSLHRLRKLY
jgi:ribonuclease Z